MNQTGSARELGYDIGGSPTVIKTNRLTMDGESVFDEPPSPEVRDWTAPEVGPESPRLLASLLAHVPGQALLWNGQAFVAGHAELAPFVAGKQAITAEEVAIKLAGDNAAETEAVQAFLSEPRDGQMALTDPAGVHREMTWSKLEDGWWLLAIGTLSGTTERGLPSAFARDLQNHLSTLRGYMALMAGGHLPTDRVGEYLGRVQEEIAREQGTLDAWRAEVARIDARPPITAIPLDLRATIASAAAAFLEEHPNRPLHMTMASRLPAVADAAGVREVLTILLMNAQRYSDPAAPIALEAHMRKDGICVSVGDQGPGIETHELKRLFEPFFRGQGAPAHATGLGLTIADAIVRAHGGRLWAESVSGQGSTFSFVLPVPTPGDRQAPAW